MGQRVAGRPPLGRPATTASVEATQRTPTLGEDQVCPRKGGGQMATIRGRPA